MAGLVSVLVHVGLGVRHNSDIVVHLYRYVFETDTEENPHTTHLFVYCMGAAVRMMNDNGVSLRLDGELH